jgi:uncharacterized protein YjbI with pentapeptide repeats
VSWAETRQGRQEAGLQGVLLSSALLSSALLSSALLSSALLSSALLSSALLSSAPAPLVGFACSPGFEGGEAKLARTVTRGQRATARFAT